MPISGWVMFVIFLLVIGTGITMAVLGWQRGEAEPGYSFVAPPEQSGGSAPGTPSE